MKDPTGSPVRIAAFIFLPSLLSILVLLLAFEFAYFNSFGKRYSASDFSTFKEPVSNAAVLASHFHFLRGKFTFKKDKIRILAIGGSTTFGMGVESENTWPALLENYLKHHFARKGPSGLEVVNLGMLGGNLEEFSLNSHAIRGRRFPREYFIFHEGPAPHQGGASWRDLAPDLVILAPQINDSATDIYYSLLSTSSPILTRLEAQLHIDEGPWKWLHHFAIRYYLLQTLELWVFHGSITRDTWDKFVRSQEEHQRIKSLEESNLRKFLDLWQGKVPVVLIRFPSLFRKGDPESAEKMAQTYLGANFDPGRGPLQRSIVEMAEEFDESVFRKISAQRKVPYYCVDCKEMGGQSFRERIQFFIDPIHRNARGNMRMAKALSLIVKGQSVVVPLIP